MVAPINYRSSILRSGDVGHDDALVFDDARALLLVPPSDHSSSPSVEDVYADLMDKEDKVLRSLDRIAKEKPAGRGATDRFLEMSVQQVALNMLAFARVVSRQVAAGDAGHAIAMLLTDPNAQIFAGLWTCAAAIVTWMISD